MYALKTYHHYLYGPKFTVYTDHQPLVDILKNPLKAETAKVTRWVLQTQLYNMEVRFRPGSSNANADFLSRIPVPATTYPFPDLTTAPICLILGNLTTEQGKDDFCKTAREKHEKQLKKRAEMEEVYRRMKDYNKGEMNSRKRYTLNSPHHDLSMPLDPQESDSDEEEFTVLNNGLLATSDGKILAPESLREKRSCSDTMTTH
jgi:hypothetical protein